MKVAWEEVSFRDRGRKIVNYYPKITNRTLSTLDFYIHKDDQEGISLTIGGISFKDWETVEKAKLTMELLLTRGKNEE